MPSSSHEFDVIIRGGRVVDPATGRNGVADVAVAAGRIAAVEDGVAGEASTIVDARGKLVIAGMIDTHAHVYQHVTGRFGLAPDLVGVRSAVTTLVDQGGPSCMTIGGFRHYICEPAASRVLCYISGYLVGGLEGHLYPELYGPGGVNVGHTVRAIEANRDLVRGIKAHAEIGGASRWGLEVIKLIKEISRAAALPVYIHLGQLWPSAEGTAPDPDELVRELVPLLEPGDVLAHPFTRHPGGFVSAATGEVHPVIWEAIERGVTVDVGHGSHFSFDMAKLALDAGIRPYTLGADMHGYNVTVPDESGADEERARNPFYGVAPFNLTIAMSELIALGLSLEDVVATVTANPARLLGMEDTLGSLAPGRAADVSVLDMPSGRFRLSDNSGNELVTERLLVAELCLRDGRLIEADSPLVPEPVRAAA